jgi:prenyltransferase beta subunit
MDRRRWLQSAAWAAGAACLPCGSESALVAQDLLDDDIESTAGKLIDAKTQRAIDRGLAWLAQRQNEDGSFAGGNLYSRNVAVVSLAAMAFMAGGHTPGRGAYGAEVDRCLDYILSRAQPDSGFIVEAEPASHGPMYGHGFAALLLAEAYGLSAREDLREPLERAIELIVRTQNDEGGWRYQPERREADLSVTICELMALRAARNAGIFTPSETVDRAVEFIKGLQNADGGFTYMTSGGPSEYPRSAAAVTALYASGASADEEIDRGLQYLLADPPAPPGDRPDSRFFYAHYYSVQAMWHAGGDRWRGWFPKLKDAILARHADGYWMDDICAEYGTGMACLILQTPNNYLPIFQR